MIRRLHSLLSARFSASVLTLLTLTLASGCATLRPAQKLSEDEVADFQHRMRSTVQHELIEANIQGDIKELAITKAVREADGSVQLGYHLAFETDGDGMGLVLHELDSEATIVPERIQSTDVEAQTIWKLTAIKPNGETLTYRDPLVIQTPRRSTSP